MAHVTRPRVAIAAAPGEADMLLEWVSAAGFEPVVCADPVGDEARSVCATLVRWPVEVAIGSLPKPVILMHEPGADLQPLVRSVADFMAVPDSRDVASLLAWSAKLGERLWDIARNPSTKPPPSCVETDRGLDREFTEAAALQPGARSAKGGCPKLIAVGVSTGGPASLRVLFDGLSSASDLPPIVIVQHIPPSYVQELVARLSEQTGYDVRFAEDNMRLRSGVAYMAPGDAHVRVRPCGDDLYVSWDHGPAIRGHRPAVDVLFESCLRLEHPGVAVMMTGMGRDGALPMLQLRQQGWATVGQDEATCTIYGMPGAAKQAGAVERELPLNEIAPWLISRCGVERQRV